MIKKKANYKTDPNIKSVTLLQNFLIFSLIAINIILLYNILSELLPGNPDIQDINRQSSLNADIQVEVLNGCGVSGIADKLTDYLRSRNFDVVNIGNYRSFEIQSSIVIDRTGNLSVARTIADSIGLKESSIIQQINREYLLDVTIILGKDYSKLIPLKKRS